MNANPVHNAHTPVATRQLVDWGAAFWAGLASGLLFLVAAVLLSDLFLGTPWLIFNLTAGIILGAEAVLAPLTAGTVVVALVVHLAMALLFAAIVAFVVHRWGMLVGIFGGAILGLALFAINYYALAALFPWFAGGRNWPLVISHILFGALAGGIYEALEEEVFVPVRPDA